MNSSVIVCDILEKGQEKNIPLNDDIVRVAYKVVILSDI